MDFVVSERVVRRTISAGVNLPDASSWGRALSSCCGFSCFCRASFRVRFRSVDPTAVTCFPDGTSLDGLQPMVQSSCLTAAGEMMVYFARRDEICRRAFPFASWLCFDEPRAWRLDVNSMIVMQSYIHGPNMTKRMQLQQTK